MTSTEAIIVQAATEDQIAAIRELIPESLIP